MVEYSSKDHWEKIYSNKNEKELGWYEQIPEPSLKLISNCNLEKDAVILDIGTGTSTLIDCLIDLDYQNIIATDISASALSKLKIRLGKERSATIKWIIDDITNSTKITNLENISLWHDRTLLHFLIEEKQRKAYLEVINKVVKKGGFVIIAVFSLKGAKKCSSLDVRNYDHEMLSDLLGSDYNLLEYFDFTYYQPSGNPRPFIYTLFQKSN